MTNDKIEPATKTPKTLPEGTKPEGSTAGDRSLDLDEAFELIFGAREFEITLDLEPASKRPSDVSALASVTLVSAQPKDREFVTEPPLATSTLAEALPPPAQQPAIPPGRRSETTATLPQAVAALPAVPTVPEATAARHMTPDRTATTPGRRVEAPATPQPFTTTVVWGTPLRPSQVPPPPAASQVPPPPAASQVPPPPAASQVPPPPAASQVPPPAASRQETPPPTHSVDAGHVGARTLVGIADAGSTPQQTSAANPHASLQAEANSLKFRQTLRWDPADNPMSRLHQAQAAAAQNAAAQDAAAQDAAARVALQPEATDQVGAWMSEDSSVPTSRGLSVSARDLAELAPNSEASDAAPLSSDAAPLSDVTGEPLLTDAPIALERATRMPRKRAPIALLSAVAALAGIVYLANRGRTAADENLEHAAEPAVAVKPRLPTAPEQARSTTDVAGRVAAASVPAAPSDPIRELKLEPKKAEQPAPASVESAPNPQPAALVQAETAPKGQSKALKAAARAKAATARAEAATARAEAKADAKAKAKAKKAAARAKASATQAGAPSKRGKSRLQSAASAEDTAADPLGNRK